MKKILIWVLVPILLAIACVVGTIAYLTAVDEENNVVTVGEARIELREYQRDGIEKNQTDDIVEFENDKLLIPSVVPDDFAYNTTPTENYVIWNADHNGEAIIVGGNTGYTSPIWNPKMITNEIDKMVFVKNTGNCNVYVRICFAFEAGNYVRRTRFEEMVHLNKNTTDWTWTWNDNLADIDGTRYFIAWATYTHVLPAGEHTKISLSQIALDFSAINDHSRAFGEKYEVKAFAQGIQADGFASASAAIAKGFDDTIPFKNCKFVEFTDLKTALHYLNADGETALTGNKDNPNTLVNSITFGLTKDHSAKVAGRKGVLVANVVNEADFTAYAYYVPIAGGTQYDIYVLADNWKIYAPNNSDSLFSGMGALKEVDTKNFDVSNVTKASHMFDDCSQLVTLDTSGWRFPNVTTTEEMFDSCSQLTVLDTSAWYLPKVTTMKRMFVGCKKLLELDVADWGITSNLTDIYQIFDDCNTLTTLDCSNWDVSGVGNMSYAFRNCKQLTELDISGWDVGNVSAFEGTFVGCIKLIAMPVDTWTWGDSTIHKATNMKSMFSGCSALTSLDLSKWEVGNVTLMDHMFSGCTSLTSVNVGGWNMGNVSTITNMFNGCYKLSDLDLSSWKFVNVSDMTSMFQNCFGLKTIDLSGWDMGNNASGISMNMMFKMELGKDGYESSELATIYVNKSWTNTKISSSHQMFLDCRELKGGKETTYNSSNVDKTYAIIDGGKDAPGYLSEKKK